MKIRRQKNKIQTMTFWRDVCIAGGQITFGVFAALWFVPPFDSRKIGVLVLNVLATIWLVLKGLKISKRL